MPDPIISRARHERALPALLVLAMVIIALALWTVIPLAWIWIASRLESGSDASFGAYGLILVGIPVTVVFLARLLGSLDRLHGRLAGRRQRRVQTAWLRSMRGERGSLHETTVLDRVMVGTLALAGVAGAVWFFMTASVCYVRAGSGSSQSATMSGRSYSRQSSQITDARSRRSSASMRTIRNRTLSCSTARFICGRNPPSPWLRKCQAGVGSRRCG